MGDNVSSWGVSDSTVEDDKDVTPAQPEAVTPLGDSGPADTNTGTVGSEVTSPESTEPQPEGVQAGGLTYTENEDGTRNYPEQQPVETVDTPLD